MQVVSSFSQEGYELYGKRFLESYVKHWPCELVVYYEDEKPDFEHEKVSFRNLFDVHGCKDYLEAVSRFPMFQGVANGKRMYQYDTFRFSRKSFAQVDAASQNQGYLFWLDADTETLEPIPEAWLEKCIEDVFMCFLGRPDWHSCASFVGWNNSHPQAAQFWQTYYNLHTSGQIFTLPEWHDSYVLDILRKESKLPARNLASHIKTEGKEKYYNVFDEVFCGKAKHYKGALKIAAA